MNKIFRDHSTILVLLSAMFFLSCKSQQPVRTGWDQVPEILDRIVPPVFPNQDFLITDYGAIGDGKTLCTGAFQEAIKECSNKGGGRVVVRAGIYLTGAIHLKSNVNLYINQDATILFSTDLEHYLPVVFTRYEGVELMNYSPLIYAFEQENIAITGEGTLDGQASRDTWWGLWRRGRVEGQPRTKSDRAVLLEMMEQQLPVSERVFGPGHYLRVNFVQPYRCKNVLIEGVTIKRSPMWEVNPVLCTNVTVRNIKTITHGPNNDGCNPESCTDVLIENCYFDTGDDCIAIKSGRNEDGRRIGVPSQNIIVRGCTMKDGHGGVSIGSEISGDCRNVFVEDCVMDSPNLERALRIKTNSLRGGVVENIYFRNVKVGQVADAVVRIYFYYMEGDAGQHKPIVRNVRVENVTSEKSSYGLLLKGYPYSLISDVSLKNCIFKNAEKGNSTLNVEHIHLENVTINDIEYNETIDHKVPDMVTKAAQAHLNGWVITDVDEIIKDGKTQYEFQTRSGFERGKISINSEGSIL